MKLKIGMIATTAGMLAMTCTATCTASGGVPPTSITKKTPVGATAARSAETREDARLKAIYTAESAWRKAQRGGSDDENDETILPVLPNVDEATQQAKLAHWTKVMAQLDALKVEVLSPAEKVNYRVFRAQIAVLINGQKFRYYEMPVNSDSAFWSELSDPPINSFKTAEDYSHYLSQLNDTPRFFGEEVADMRAGLARRFTPPKVTLEGRDVSIATIAEAKRAEDTPYWKPFATMLPSIPESRQGELRAEARTAIEQKIIPAYAELLKFFREEYVPGAQEALAAESLPNGKAYYQAKILEYTTVDLTPEQIHEIGLHEMAGIHAEMLAVIQQTGFKGDFPAFLQYLRTDPQFYAKTPEELLMRAAYISKEFDGVSARYFGYLPRQRFAIRPVPPEIAPFYTSGRGGPGVYFVNTYDLPSRSLYSLPALTLHESAPGHAFQIPIAAEHKDLPKFRGAYISAYGEGWAVYCERLGTEMGIYHTPYETFGMLSYQAWRAARLVVDTGIHSQGWTREQARQYLRDNTALSEHEVDTEVDRYISWPGQALSYYLGELSILKERHKAEAALGAKFNIRAFHDAVLETGSVPLPVLEEHLDQWIAGGGVGPYPEMER
ncbi:DUF885 family protein [Granulicella mallensis]|uniref:Uncharacterized protein (DUF885 family) n=1 Tax=Granulicella mallensis TaxID=940614 RepID=A0A7W7ZNE8_9BACT|nr:DUF885 family protein [Granulicella mallensis]MBB5063175.1 uncharacterized protein (DUF885 family) [Granulicella mallensis]